MPHATAARRAIPIACLVLLVIPGSSGCSTGARPAPSTSVRAAVLPFLTHAPFHLAVAEGYFAEEGLDVELVRLRRVQQVTDALARGEVDVAAGMPSVNILNTIASGRRVRLVGALGYLSGECPFHAFVARRELLDSGALADSSGLRTLRVDANLLLIEGFWMDTALAAERLGVDDLQLIDISPGDTRQALLDDAVDIAGLPEPQLSDALATGEIAIWRDSHLAAADQPMSVLMYGTNLLDERPDVGERFATAMLRGIRAFQEGRTERNLAVVESSLRLTPESAATVCWPYARDDGRVDADSLRPYQEWALTRGLVERVMTAEEMVDDRFMVSAATALAASAGSH